MPTNTQSKSQHVLELARDLLDDIELSRIGNEALLLKGSRLARLSGTEEEQAWLKLELGGYHSGSPIAEKYLSLTGRWIDREKGTAYWGPFAQQEATIEALKLRQQSLSTQGLAGEWASSAVARISNDSLAISSQLSSVGGIRSRVLGLLHKFVVRVYYERIFSSAAESIFERYQHSVDGLLVASAGQALEKLPAIFDRLAEKDSEAVSQAMNTCRRLINAFADAIYPPTDQQETIEGQQLKTGKEHYQNRINLFIADSTESASRRKRLKQTLSNIYNRVCAGVHDDITAEEGQALVLATYGLLGEISTMARQQS